MTCREFIRFLIEYRSGALSQKQHTKFERHLAECSDCLVYLKSYEATITLGKGSFTDPDAPVPQDVPEELIQAILTSRRQDKEPASVSSP